MGETKMRAIILTLAAALSAAPLAASAAMSADQTKAFTAVQRYDAAFNKGDSKTIVGMCAPGAIIIDDFAPHIWQGANACGAWLNDLGAYDKKSGNSGGIVTLKKPWHVDVTGNRAYVVVPVTYTYKQHGKPVVEDGSVWSLVLQRAGADWRIAGWAWGQH
jgi:ketosteroid isomerase-like protein